MCLGEIIRLEAVSASSARGRLGDRVVSVSLVTLGESVAEGDWVVVHSGFALHRLEPGEAAEALALRAGDGHPAAHGLLFDPHSPSTHPQEES